MNTPIIEPKRYTAAGSGVVRTDSKGDLVLYVDYLRLLIEVDELKSQPDPLTAYLYAAELAKDDIKRLKAEVERLNKLFNNVENCRRNIIYCKRHPEDAYGIPNDHRADTFNQWMNRLKEAVESAKEGNPNA